MSDVARYNELKHVVIVGNADYVEREWDTLEMLPKILVLHGSPMSRADLRAVNVNLSDMCVILSAKMSSVEDPSMADKEAVLATLNINAMTFNKVWYNIKHVSFSSFRQIVSHAMLISSSTTLPHWSAPRGARPGGRRYTAAG